jgi:hypothetical protein
MGKIMGTLGFFPESTLAEFTYSERNPFSTD